MSDQVESDQVSEDAPPPEEISPDKVTSNPSPDAEEAAMRRILDSPEFEKAVQKHSNRESANARQRIDALEEQTMSSRNELLGRYDALIEGGMKPAAARQQLDIEEVLQSYKQGGGQVEVTDTESDNVGALSGDDAKSAASSLLDRMGVTGNAKNEILEDVSRRVSYSTQASLDDTVYDLVNRWNVRQQKMSDSQTPISDSAADTPPTPDKLDELQIAFDKEVKVIMQGGGGSTHLIEIRRKYRKQGLEV